jgi:hypothetical protein
VLEQNNINTLTKKEFLFKMLLDLHLQLRQIKTNKQTNKQTPLINKIFVDSATNSLGEFQFFFFFFSSPTVLFYKAHTTFYNTWAGWLMDSPFCRLLIDVR